jgi:hypothetical protein
VLGGGRRECIVIFPQFACRRNAFGGVMPLSFMAELRSTTTPWERTVAV